MSKKFKNRVSCGNIIYFSNITVLRAKAKIIRCDGSWELSISHLHSTVILYNVRLNFLQKSKNVSSRATGDAEIKAV